ncbi:archease [Pseudonocardia acidicola]|uniref:Archease n=1 Tax=Pseudonocardia acidicola TaxID=2724939 RepID=A0ABX1SBS0_9PSEU|nr:archease [Pseudonocardia acidicola]NMH97633.1 archease [Pseudonocardia acidicola]
MSSPPAGGAEGRRGHRSLPHTADLRLQAWAPSREECVTEAVRALVAAFADVTGRAPQRTALAEIHASTDEDALLSALEETIFLLDTDGAVPVSVRAEPTASGLRLHLGLVPLADVEIIGPAPKAVTMHRLRLGHDRAGWSCEATVDI